MIGYYAIEPEVAVSANALSVLKRFQIAHASVEPIKEGDGLAEEMEHEQAADSRSMQ